MDLPAGAITMPAGTVKIALLLPMSASGSARNVAKALKQAAELALFDFDNQSVALVPKDTRGTPDGARLAAESAVQDGAELIIGPLFAQEVRGAAQVARRAGVPMVAQYPFGPVTTSALNVTLLSYQDDLHIGVAMNDAAIDDPHDLRRES